MVISVLIALSLLLSYLHLTSYFINALWGFNIIVWVILLLIIWIRAGFIVIDSLVFVAAELSLMIYLAQSYCSISNKSTESNNALRSLLTIGIMYISIRFFGSIIKRFKEVKNKEKFIEDKITMAIFMFITSLLVWQIYLVVNPIFNDLCVFKSTN